MCLDSLHFPCSFYGVSCSLTPFSEILTWSFVNPHYEKTKNDEVILRRKSAVDSSCNSFNRPLTWPTVLMNTFAICVTDFRSPLDHVTQPNHATCTNYISEVIFNRLVEQSAKWASGQLIRHRRSRLCSVSYRNVRNSWPGSISLFPEVLTGTGGS